MLLHTLVRQRLPAVVAALALAACAQASSPDGPAGQTLEPLTIRTASGVHAFQVEIADDEAERSRGLMFRPPLEDDRGMLFQFPDSQERSFWMHNTPSSLDIIYIAADGRIVSIARNTTPNSDAPIPSYGPARGVLEIRAGRAAEIGAQPGDRVEHPFFRAN
ncbi:DUF192 domain-containing protein [Brevundimonas sp. 2R-24]|uniref:DUF192 domain-containing protein n=1 Tax=Peiella sedimenti TaxID=3061083 RepID=A0ABT8SJB7_9CAUL|nr:DUF192 domain-containing protein [Caulobacteraceae bacterium XZ-24]